MTVTVEVTNVGDRPATAVVQVYASAVEPPVERAPKDLRGWRKVVVAPGQRAGAEIVLGPSAFRRWDESGECWKVDPGRYDLIVASSAGASAEHQRVAVTIR